MTDEQLRQVPEAGPQFPWDDPSAGRVPGASAEAESEEPLRRPRRTSGPPADGLAIAALVTAIAGLSLVGVVLGHLALARIARRGSGGRGLAVAALVLGYLGLVLALAGWTVYFAVLAPLVTLPG